MTLQIGDTAPDFTLKGHDDQEYTLGALVGTEPIVLVFYPLDFSPVCTRQHACFVDDAARFSEYRARVFGISVDSAWTHKAFAQQMKIAYPLLADFHPKGAVASKYGVYLPEKGIAERVTFVIDRSGKIAAIHRVDIPVLPEMDPVHHALAALHGEP